VPVLGHESTKTNSSPESPFWVTVTVSVTDWPARGLPC
jgi:hypothetical protein